MGCCCVLARHAVSRKKERTIDKDVPKGGVDLDLVQVHRNIVCMGLPAFGLESLYRNPYDDALRYLDFKYGANYKVYNLCSEPEHRYDKSFFHGQVSEFSFPDHWACPLSMIPLFLKDALKYINDAKPLGKRVVVIHCKAGKGRTGLFTCCLLMELEPSIGGSADKAIEYYGRKRTRNGQGLTLPSQKRYVHYYETLRRGYRSLVPDDVPVFRILSFQLQGIIKKLVITSCRWYINGKVCDVSLKASTGIEAIVSKSPENSLNVDLAKHSFFKEVSHDVRIEFLNAKRILGALTFHTLFIQKSYNFRAMDKLCKLDFSDDAGIFFEYERVAPLPSDM